MSEKQYVFITPNVDGIGGAQRYIECKSSWLIEREWSVVIITSSCNSTILLSFSGVDIVNLEQLQYKPSCLSQISVNKMLERMQQHLHSDSKVFIESSTMSLSYWGELLAERVGASHLIFHLSETLPVLSHEEHRFFDFKNSRHELAFITEALYNDAIAETNRTSGSHTLRAYMGSNVLDIPFDDLRSNFDFSIGVISRLEKPYINNAVNGLVSFCLNHADKKVLLDLVGDAPEESVKDRIKAMTSEALNLSIAFRGALSEIPQGLLDSWDAALCKAGAAGLTSRAGVPTIQFSLETDECVGVRCFDFDPIMLGKADRVFKVEECLEKILVSRVFDRGKEKWIEPPYVSDFSNHLSYVQQCQSEYFDTKICQPTLLSRIAAYYRRIFGNEPPFKRRL